MNSSSDAVASRHGANRKPYPSDVSDEEWAFVAPYLALAREDVPHHSTVLLPKKPSRKTCQSESQTAKS